MEITNQDELKAHLMATDESFRNIAEQHSELHRQIEALEAKSHLTPADEEEEHRIKKLKLKLKDQMNEIIARHKTEHVA